MKPEMKPDMFLNIGDTVYWVEDSYPYLVQNAKVTEILKAEGIVKKRTKTVIVGCKVEHAHDRKYPLKDFYLTEKDAALHQLQSARFQRSMVLERLNKLDESIKCMQKILKEGKEGEE